MLCDAFSVLSETTDSSEEEWQSISDLASACRNILEALSQEDRKSGDGTHATMTQPGQTETKFKDFKDSDSPGHLEEKVSQLEAMLKRLQDDLQRVNRGDEKIAGGTMGSHAHSQH
ncbi:signal-induced proliferation-associated protein [Pimephales promelas]|nr:signal-induced proliferation-associated protein [Pimephales promelas]